MHCNTQTYLLPRELQPEILHCAALHNPGTFLCTPWSVSLYFLHPQGPHYHQLSRNGKAWVGKEKLLSDMHVWLIHIAFQGFGIKHCPWTVCLNLLGLLFWIASPSSTGTQKSYDLRVKDVLSSRAELQFQTLNFGPDITTLELFMWLLMVRRSI